MDDEVDSRMVNGMGAMNLVTPPETPVPLERKYIRLLYQPMIFLACLNPLLQIRSHHSHEQETSTVNIDASQLYRRFLNSLALFCDSRPGGKTVTALTVLSNPTTYSFACNERGPSQLEGVKRYLGRVLDILKPGHVSDVRQAVLRISVVHCTERFKYYAKRISIHVGECVDGLIQEEKDFTEILRRLDKIRKCADRVISPNGEENYVAESLELINLAYTLSHSDNPAWALVLQKTLPQNTVPRSPWWELKHYTGRLQAYRNATESLVYASNHWPGLVQDFDIVCVPPTPKATLTLSFNSPTPKEIIGRVTSDKDRMAKLKSMAEELDMGPDPDLRLTDSIRKVWPGDKMTPLVHAEIALLDYLQRTGPTPPSRFFENFRYIGASKFTCLMCHYYFQGHESGVEVSPTHRNIYISWRLPNIFPSQGKNAQIQRGKTAQRIINSLRIDIGRALEDRTADRRRHDSMTELTSSTLRHHAAGLTGMLKEVPELADDDDMQAYVGSDTEIEKDLPKGGEKEPRDEGVQPPPSMSATTVYSRTVDKGTAVNRGTNDMYGDSSDDEDNGGGALI